MNAMIKYEQVAEKVITLREQKVLLDSDVAELYGVETMRVNEAVKNNPDKFPDGYILTLTKNEKKEVVENFDNLKLKFSPSLPNAFTEKGLYMLATILKSPRAVQTTLAIVETFARTRELARTVAALPETSDKAAQKSLMQRGGEIIAEILDESLPSSETETSFEIDLAMLKFKHTRKRAGKKK